MNNKQLEKPEFYEYFAECTPLLVSPPLEPFGRPTEKYWGRGIHLQLMAITRIHARYYIRRKETLGVGKFMVSRLLKEKGLFERALKDFKEHLSGIMRVFKRIEKMDLASTPLEKLIEIENEINRRYTNSYAAGYLVEPSYFYLEQKAIGLLMALLAKNNLEKNYSEYFVDLTPIYKEPFHGKEERELLGILLEIEKIPKYKKIFSKDSGKIMKELEKHPIILGMLEEHAKKYHWISNSYASTSKLGLDYFLNSIKEKMQTGKKAERQLANSRAKRADWRKRKRRAIKELGISGELQKLFDLIGKIAYYQDFRKTLMLRSVYYSQLIAKEIARRVGISEAQIVYALPKEIELETILDPAFKAQLKVRAKNCLLAYDFDGANIYHGLEAIQKERGILKLKPRVKMKNPTNLLGVCASLGYAVGRAKIINSSKDIWKIKKGDVLVAKATRPEIVPAMKLACAIVTDEGGITSHAAIVSRELGKPCVIGTSIASKVFKDNDLLEVRANHGAVYKLEE
ncbi:MAG: PEP-utilizing enzyme [Candidatus Micrarchaeota archaeon]